MITIKMMSGIARPLPLLSPPGLGVSGTQGLVRVRSEDHGGGGGGFENYRGLRAWELEVFGLAGALGMVWWFCF